jgi:RNA polymerase sigma-70 factor, ECF subfamily
VHTAPSSASLPAVRNRNFEKETVEPSDHTASLHRLLAADRDALVARVARRVPRGMCGVVAAEDVVQEAALAAVASVGAFRPDGEDSLRRWLGGIVRHQLCDFIKAQQRRNRSCRAAGVVTACGRAAAAPALEAVTAGDSSPCRAATDGEDRAALRRALAGLPAAYRDAIRLRYLEGLTVAQVADRLGRTTGAALMLCNRGLKRLRRAMGCACGSGAPSPCRRALAA